MIPDLRNTKESPGHSPVTYRKMAGIVCFLLKIHPRRQCILGSGVCVVVIVDVNAECNADGQQNGQQPEKNSAGKRFFFWFFIELLYFISIFRNRCSRCRSVCCHRSRSLRGNGAYINLPAGWGSPSRPRGQNGWDFPESSYRIYKPSGFAAACWAGGNACRP